jgi:hypothetical protein
MVMYSFVPPFREAICCGVSTCVFDKLGCAVGEKGLRNTGLEECFKTRYNEPISAIGSN